MGASPFPRRAPGKRRSKAGREAAAVEPDDRSGREGDYTCTGSAGASVDKTIEGALRCRNSKPAKAG
jgi:hypothetical protein